MVRARHPRYSAPRSGRDQRHATPPEGPARSDAPLMRKSSAFMNDLMSASYCALRSVSARLAVSGDRANHSASRSRGFHADQALPPSLPARDGEHEYQHSRHDSAVKTMAIPTSCVCAAAPAILRAERADVISAITSIGRRHQAHRIKCLRCQQKQSSTERFLSGRFCCLSGRSFVRGKTNLILSHLSHRHSDGMCGYKFSSEQVVRVVFCAANS